MQPKTILNDAPLFVHFESSVRDRLKKQTFRFGVNESALVRMAIIKWLEEEEAFQAEQEARVKAAKMGIIRKEEV